MKIKIHSFIDVITNSSTEIYIQVGEQTINFIKRLVDATLRLTKSDLKSEDLFIFDITEDEENDWSTYTESYLTVTPKENLPEEVTEICKMITEELRDIFEIDAAYEG